jgi:glutaredoxin
MFKLKKILIATFFIFLFFPLVGKTESNYQVDLYFFEGQGCPHCAKMKSYLEGLKKDYPNLKVYDFEVYFSKENQELFDKMAKAYKTDSNGVPMVFIDDEVISGEDFEKVKNAIERCSDEICISPMEKIKETPNTNNSNDSMPTAGKSKNEIVGWAVIGGIILVGMSLTIFYFKNKNNV